MKFCVVLVLALTTAVLAEEDDVEIARQAMENPDLFGGDMDGVDPYDPDKNGMKDERYRWPEGKIPYEIDFSLEEHKDAIQKAINHYHATTCVRFIPRTTEKDYVRFFKGQGCYSRMGRQGGPQVLSLGRGCHSVGVIIHEMGHALGFYHEQNRSDRDEYLIVYLYNVKDGMHFNFQKLHPSQNILYNKFDYDSIMIYGNTAFSKDGKSPTMVVRNGQKLLYAWDKNGMTKSDIERVKMMYKCP